MDDHDDVPPPPPLRSPRSSREPRRPFLWATAALGVSLVLGVVVATAALAVRQTTTTTTTPSRDAVWAAFARVIGGRRASSFACGAPNASFYAYSCAAAAAEETQSTFVALEERVEERLSAILSEGWPIVGTWYAACRNTSARRVAGTAALEHLLDAIDTVRSVETLSRAVAVLHRAGAPALFTSYVAADELAPRTAPRLLYVDALDPLLPADIWANNVSSLAAAARARVAELVAALMDGDEQLAAEALSVDELQLAPVAPTAAARRSAPPAERDVAWDDLPAVAFNWTAYAEELYAPPLRSQPPPATVAVRAREYLETATAMAAHNDWGTVRAYLRARLMVSVAADLPTNETLVEQCVASVEEALPDLLGHYYVRAYFDADAARPLAASIVARVIAAFERRLAANTWMDSATRAAALAKAAAIRPEVAFPSEGWTLTLPRFAILEDAHLENVLAAREDAATQNYAGVGHVPSPNAAPHWLMSTYEVNAYYSPPDNDIVFPAGILQGSFFHVDAPLAVNYGGLGAVAGHEITHAFDDEGREYDAVGARRDWWSPASASAFARRAACVVDLYSACPSDDGAEHVDGVLTLGENLADLGGVPTAYAAYLDALNATYPRREDLRAYENAVEATFGVTHEQLFFAAYAHTWCTRRRSPDLAYLLLHTDPHSPPRWRVDVPTSQSAEFARAFHCPSPSVSPCAVW
jgi:endothelin-converting enzyme/putative endopeptidase